MMGEDGIQRPFANFFDYGFAVQDPQPPHPRPERAAAILIGEDGIESPFVFVQAPFPPLIETPPTYKRYPFNRGGAVRPADPSTYARLIPFLPQGWLIPPPLLRRVDRPNRAAAILRGDDGTQAKFVRPPIIWGFEQPFYAPPARNPRRGALARGVDGTDAIFRHFVPMGWDPSEPTRRLRRGWNRVQVFEQAPNFFPPFLIPTWVHDNRIEQLIPRHRRGGALAVNNDMLQTFRGPLSFAPLDWWPPETFYRKRRTAGALPYQDAFHFRRFVSVMFATSVITRYGAPTVVTQAEAATSVTAASGETVVRGEREGR